MSKPQSRTMQSKPPALKAPGQAGRSVSTAPKKSGQPTAKPASRAAGAITTKPSRQSKPIPNQAVSKQTSPSSKTVTSSPKSPQAVRKAPAQVSRPQSSQQPKKPPPPQAAQEQPQATNWLNRTVQNGVAYVGDYAGGLVNSVGDSVNRVGEGIGNR